MRVLIIESDLQVALLLKRKIEATDNAVEVLKIVASIEDAHHHLNESDLSLVFCSEQFSKIDTELLLNACSGLVPVVFIGANTAAKWEELYLNVLGTISTDFDTTYLRELLQSVALNGINAIDQLASIQMNLDDEKEADLISSIQLKRETAIKSVYKEFYRPLCYFSRRIVTNNHEAEDITVEAFLKFLSRAEQFSSIKEVRSFLFTTVKNASIDYLRKQRVVQRSKEELSLVQDLSNEQIDLEEIRARVLQNVYAEIERLPPQCKKIFKAFFFEGKTTSVIANELRISPQTVLNQKIKAVKFIRVSLLRKRDHLSLGILFYLCCNIN